VGHRPSGDTLATISTSTSILVLANGDGDERDGQDECGQRTSANSRIGPTHRQQGHRGNTMPAVDQIGDLTLAAKRQQEAVAERLREDHFVAATFG